MVDPAFVSRVNLGMEFPELDSATRLQIWKQMLKELGSSSGADWLLGEEQALRNWASKPLNGRQIRNVIYSARLLADPPMIGSLTKKGIEECLQDVINFSKSPLLCSISPPRVGEGGTGVLIPQIFSKVYI